MQKGGRLLRFVSYAHCLVYCVSVFVMVMVLPQLTASLQIGIVWVYFESINDKIRSRRDITSHCVTWLL